MKTIRSNEWRGQGIGNGIQQKKQRERRGRSMIKTTRTTHDSTAETGEYVPAGTIKNKLNQWASPNGVK